MLCIQEFKFIPMGSLPNNHHRLSRNQILGHCRVLCIALTEQKIETIKLGLKEKKFVRDLILTTKTIAILLGMALVSELSALRVLAVLLLIILIALSFYILFDALERCKEVTSKLNQEMADMMVLTRDSDDED